jgi:hypothetical protein
MSGGEILESNYKVVFPFEMRLGVIVVKVTIQQEEYDFLFDTGAPNVVSFELGEKLKLKPVGKTQTKGSQGERHKIDYTNIDTLQLGGLNYLNTTAAIMDLKKAVSIECMGIDGILGANVMRNSVWQIDYQKQTITITNTTDSLTFSNNLDTIPFTTQHTGTPKIKVQIGNIIQSGVTLDSGSGGHIDLNYNTYKLAKKRNPDMHTASGFGNSTTGIYGMGKPDTLIYFKPDSISIGTIKLENQICYASVGKTSSTLGTRFLENYIITLDWDRNQMVLDSVEAYHNSELKNFGYKTVFSDNKLKIGFLFNNSETGSNTLQLNDDILRIDTIDFTQISKSDYCKLILDTTKNKLNLQSITVSRDSNNIIVPLIKSVILK